MAARLHNVFIKMWGSMDDFGQITDLKTWVKTTRQMGKMLGYPNTAIDSFIRNKTEHRDKNDSLTVISNQYRGFAHSNKHLDDEVRTYDKPLSEAVSRYAPKSYKILY